MAFKSNDYDNEGYSGIFDGPAMLRKQMEPLFEKIEDSVRDLSKEERIRFGQNSLGMFAEFVTEHMTFSGGYTKEQFILTFMACATELGFAGLDPIPAEKKDEVAEMLSLFGEKEACLENDQFYDWRQFRDKDHQMLVDNFLGSCTEPILHRDFLVSMVAYMLSVCYADKRNEKGILAAQKVWKEYWNLRDNRRRNPNYEYNGTYDRSHFCTAAQTAKAAVEDKAQKGRSEEAKKAQKEAEEKALREDVMSCCCGSTREEIVEMLSWRNINTSKIWSILWDLERNDYIYQKDDWTYGRNPRTGREDYYLATLYYQRTDKERKQLLEEKRLKEQERQEKIAKAKQELNDARNRLSKQDSEIKNKLEQLEKERQQAKKHYEEVKKALVKRIETQRQTLRKTGFFSFKKKFELLTEIWDSQKELKQLDASLDALPDEFEQKRSEAQANHDKTMSDLTQKIQSLEKELEHLGAE